MTIGYTTDFVNWDQLIWDLFTETLQQNAENFNTQSRGALEVISATIAGDFMRQRFIPQISGVTHRDPTDTGDATPLSLGMSELIWPKVARMVGPFQDNKAQWRKILEDPGAMEKFVVQQMMGTDTAGEIPIDYLNTLLAAMVACLTSGGAVVGDGTGQITSLLIEDLKQVMGDRKQRIRILVMTSIVHTALVKDQITKQIFTTDGASIYAGIPATGGLPVLVTDSPSLIDTTESPDHERVLALVDAAGAIVQTQEREFLLENVTGKASGLQQIFQGEYSFNVVVKGYQWDETAINPDNAALGTDTNWTNLFTDIKSGPGAMLIVQKPGATG